MRPLVALLASLLLCSHAAPAWAADAPPAAHGDRWLFLPRGNPLIAASLSLAWNGTGQLYNGETEKGMGMMAGWLAYPLAYGVDSLTGSGYMRLFAFTANMGIKAWSVSDAYRNAVRPASPSPSVAP